MPITDDNRHLALDANDRIANAGERVMVVAQRDLDPAAFARGGDLIDLVSDLTLLAMVGIVDPPRAEAKAAIAECRDAGIRVRMITGDHATTAAAIAARARHRGAGDHRRRVRRDERRASCWPSSTRSASSRGWRPRTRSGSSSCSSGRATSSR